MVFPGEIMISPDRTTLFALKKVDSHLCWVSEYVA